MTSVREHVERLNFVTTIIDGQIPLLATKVRNPRLLIDMVNCWLNGEPELPRELHDEPVVRARPANVNVLVFATQDVAIIRRWRRHKVIYTVDPNLAAELADSDPDDVIPGRLLLEQMPHPNPYVSFPEPKRIELTGVDSDNKPGQSRGDYALLYGAFLYGIRADRTMADTTDPEAAFLALGLVGPVFYADGSPVLLADGSPDVIMIRTSIRAQTAKLGEIVEDTIARYRGDLHDADPLQPSRGARYRERLVRDLITTVVPMVLYLVAANADRRTVPRVAVPVIKRQDRKARPKDAPTVVEYGFRIGQALSAARRETEHRNRSMPLGQRLRPHVRRAHWHTFRTGKGRTGRVLRWLPPIPINVVPDVDAAEPVVYPTHKVTRSACQPA